MSEANPPHALLRPGVALPFLAISLIWGSAWYIITGQIDGVPAMWSVTWRFALATLGMFALVLVTRGQWAMPRRAHHYPTARANNCSSAPAPTRRCSRHVGPRCRSAVCEPQTCRQPPNRRCAACATFRQPKPAPKQAGLAGLVSFGAQSLSPVRLQPLRSWR